MPARAAVNRSARLATALLKAAAAKGWGELTVADVARAAKMKVAEVKALAPDKAGLLRLLNAWVDDEMVAAISSTLSAEPMHDRLFEVLMARFDVLESHREGFAAIFAGVTQDLCSTAEALPPLLRSMERVLGAANLGQIGVISPVKIICMSIIYVKTLRVWLKDQTPDLSRTMSELNKNINIASQLFDKAKNYV